MNIKSLGLKNTKARENLIHLFRFQKKPIDATRVSSLFAEKGLRVDQATIYRALNTFSEKGVVKEVYFNDGVVRYELAGKPEHHHIVCLNCGKVEDILDCSVEKIEKHIEKKKNFTVISHSLEFFGLCPKCKSKSKS